MEQFKAFFNEKILPFFKDRANRPKIIIGSAVAAAAVLAAVLGSLYVNVWSWVDDITVYMPADVFVSSLLPSHSDGVSKSDVSGSDVSGSDVSASDIEANIKRNVRLKKGSTVGDALAALNVVLDESLSVDTPLDAVVSEGMRITVYRLKLITVTADGNTVSTYTDLATVAELLAEQGITLGENDRITVSSTDAALENGMEIIIYRVEIIDEIKTEEIPFTTEKQENSSMLRGESKVVTEGKNGEKEVTYRSTYVDGLLESTVIAGERVTLEPVTEVIEIGTRVTTTTRRTTRKTKKTSSGKKVVSKEAVYDCDGSGHGYYIITYSDGSVVYQDF